MSAAGRPAWIEAWALGLARGRRARVDDLPLHEAYAAGPGSGVLPLGPFIIGVADGLGDPDGPVSGAEPLAWRLVTLAQSTAAEAFGVWVAGNELASLPFSWAAGAKGSPWRSPRRGSCGAELRAQIPPRVLLPGTVAFRAGWFAAARRGARWRGLRRPSPWTMLGLGVAVLLWDAVRYRRDGLAWAQFVASDDWPM